MTLLYDHKYVETNGIRLHVVQAGPQDGKPVILLHGFPEFWYGWRHQIPDLAERGYRVWAADQRGYNLSDKPSGIAAYNLDQTAADIKGLIEATGREKALLVAHDWGAAAAWWAAMKYPEKIERLVILNVPHPLVSARTIRSNAEQRRRSWYMFYFQIPWLPEASLRPNNWQPMADSLHKTSRPGTFTDEDLALYREAWSQSGAMKAMINWYRAAFQHFPNPPANPRVTVPVRIIWGKRDTFIIPSAAQSSVEYTTQGELFYIDEATHWVQHEEPERVNALIGEFFAAS